MSKLGFIGDLWTYLRREKKLWLLPILLLLLTIGALLVVAEGSLVSTFVYPVL